MFGDRLRVDVEDLESREELSGVGPLGDGTVVKGVEMVGSLWTEVTIRVSFTDYLYHGGPRFKGKVTSWNLFILL